MRRIDHLESTMAIALGVDEGGIRTRAMHLRKADMYCKGSGGRPMPDPTSTHATNLLLSVLGGGNAQDAAQTVGRMRSSIGVITYSEDGYPVGAGPLPALAGLTGLPDATLGSMLDALFTRLAAGEPIIVDEAEWVRRIDRVGDFLSKRDSRRLMKARREIDELGLLVVRTWMGVHTTLVCKMEEPSLYKEDFSVSYELPDADIAALLTEGDPGNALDLLSTARRAYARSASETWLFHQGFDAIGASLRGDVAAVEKMLRWPSMDVQREGPKGPKAGVKCDFRWGRLHIVLPPPPPPPTPEVPAQLADPKKRFVRHRPLPRRRR